MSVVTRFARGGSERRLLDAVDALDTVDHIVVVGHGSNPDRVRSDLAGCEVHWCTDLRREISPPHDLKALVWLVSRLRVWKPELVMTHQSKAGQLARVAGALTGAVVVHSASMATFGPGYSRGQDLLYRGVERATSPLVDSYVCVGHDLARRLAEGGLPANRIDVVRSSIEERHLDRRADSDDAEDLRGSVGLSAEGLLIGYVGSLEQRKGVRELPEILRRVHDESPGGAGLVIAGDGPLSGPLQDAFRLDGLEDRVAMLGHVDDVGSVIRAVDVIVLPSSAEGLPQVLVQAIAWDTPFVAYAVDGVEELLGLGAAGAVVPLGDVQALATAVSDGALRVAPGAGGATLEMLDEWRPEVVRERYRELARSWRKARRPRSGGGSG